MAEIDDAFIKRVYRSSAFLWAFGLLVLLGLWPYLTAKGVALSPKWGWLAGLGWTLGSAVSVATLWSLEWIVRRAFVPGNIQAKRNLGRFSLVKLVVIAIVLAVIAKLGGKSFALISAFCAGVVLTQAVIFLKVLGMLICEHSND
ncbi:MAG: hypothetical protein ABFD49_08130 [Armatimonadota bacterium]|nr:hypothetical protein [bacterium]